MKRIILKVRNKSQIKDLEQFGLIVFKSPILNTVIMEIDQNNIENLEKHDNVESYEIDHIGELMII